MYKSIHFVFFSSFTFFHWESFAIPDTKSILDSLAKKNTAINIRVLFHNDKSLQILQEFESKRSSMAFTARNEKENEFYKMLKAHADATQKKTMDALQTLLNSRDQNQKTNDNDTKASFDQMWMLNQLFVWNADEEIVNLLGMRDEVASIEEEQWFEVNLTEPKKLEEPTARTITWGISTIQVRESSLGANMGKGAVVGIIDTGVKCTHETLKNQFRSDYGWFDPQKKSKEPYDLIGHGTSVAGVAVGSNGFGVAPEAQWIACRGINTGATSKIAGSMYIDNCMQWMNCPTDTNGKNPDCSKRPHVVNNSWFYPLGFSAPPNILNRLRAWQINNIVAVFSNGNSGPDCSTTLAPATEENVISVGATNIRGGMLLESSAGPVRPVFEPGRVIIKPDVVAPGEDIPCPSIDSNTSFHIQSGTSLAAPHVSGLAALYFSYDPNGTVDAFKKALIRGVSTVKGPGMHCGGVKDYTYPNNHAGYRIVNAVKFSKQVLLEISARERKGVDNNSNASFNKPNKPSSLILLISVLCILP